LATAIAAFAVSAASTLRLGSWPPLTPRRLPGPTPIHPQLAARLAGPGWDITGASGTSAPEHDTEIAALDDGSFALLGASPQSVRLAATLW
jgi:hypothetical protein